MRPQPHRAAPALSPQGSTTGEGTMQVGCFPPLPCSVYGRKHSGDSCHPGTPSTHPVPVQLHTAEGDPTEPMSPPAPSLPLPQQPEGTSRPGREAGAYRGHGGCGHQSCAHRAWGIQGRLLLGCERAGSRGVLLPEAVGARVTFPAP